MRLIDADKLLEDMKKELEKAVNDENINKADCMVIMTSAIALKDFVNRQTTAFNVDKVIRQLEEEKNCLENKFMNGEERVFGAMMAYKNTIDIVRAGGIDD